MTTGLTVLMEVTTMAGMVQHNPLLQIFCVLFYTATNDLHSSDFLSYASQVPPLLPFTSDPSDVDPISAV